MGSEGNDFFQILELPALRRLAHPHRGERALDLGTGNGLVARWLVSEGVLVTATDASNAILQTAVHRFKEIGTNDVVFRKLDVTEPADFERLIRDYSDVCGPSLYQR